MYLKRLELVGFKSFAAKTVLEFPAGITAIVGPNGSGKSNVIDAIRWLMGEREAKNMRGLKAEDLIFAGTPARPRVGMAQAAIIFDNTNHFFPVDYSEVSIRRRVERDGTSQYFLNDADARLKDIIAFFAESRLGTKGFSIVNQGDSDLFVRSLPKERRAMLEEILGLRQYQLKKHDAELKLKNTQFNMEKAQALIDEIVPHLRLLRRQTAKWEKHADIERELRELEDAYFSVKMRGIEEDSGMCEPRRKELDTEMRMRVKELAALHGALLKVEELEPKTDARLEARAKEQGELSGRRSELLRELGRVEAQIEIGAARGALEANAQELVKLLEETRETIEDALYESDLKKIKALLKTLFEKINDLLDHEERGGEPILQPDLDAARANLSQEFSLIEKKLAAHAETEREVNASLKDFNALFRKAFEAIEEKKNEIRALEQKQNKLQFEEERIRLRREDLAHQASQAGRKLSEFRAAEARKDVFDTAEAEKRMLKLRGELAGIGDIDELLIREAKETEDRYEFLKTQVADLGKAYADLMKLINELDEKIHRGFSQSLRSINDEFHTYFRMMFGGGQAKLTLQKPETEKREGEGESGIEKQDGGTNMKDADAEHAADHGGLDIKISIPRKRINSLDMLSGGEKSLVSLAALFALISVSPPPFLVLDEVDAALDEDNAKRFADLIKEFSKKTQFLLVTHNRATMVAADILYGVTMAEDGTSKVLSLKLE